MIKKILEKIRKIFSRKTQKEKTEVKKEIGKPELNFLLPKGYEEKFDIMELKEKQQEWNLIIHEKPENIPLELKGKKVVLNGYCKRLEIIDYPLKDKPMYVHIYRRRWKEKGSRKSYENHYELHPEGIKVTPEFGDFLKELSEQEYCEYISAWPNIRYLSQKAFSMV